MDDIKFLRLEGVINVMGLKRSAIYAMIKNGMLPKPIKFSRRASVWPNYEIQTVARALISGADEDRIKALVQKLSVSRATV